VFGNGPAVPRLAVEERRCRRLRVLDEPAIEEMTMALQTSTPNGL
jgi:hypothetical protein